MATAALVFTAISAVAAVASISQTRKAGKEQRRQNKIKGRIEATRRIRGIKRSIAASRIRRGEIESAGFGFGVAGGTAVQGAAGGLQGDLGSAIGASNQQFTGQQAVAASQDRVSSLQQSAAVFGGISGLAGSFDEQSLSSIGSLFT